jgi:hypothetical protein
MRRALSRVSAAFRLIHRAIEVAKTLRLSSEPGSATCDDRSVEPSAYRSRHSDGAANKFPQRPLVLGDKWDF